MANDGILVNHDSLENMITEMKQHVSAMQGRVDQLMRDLAPLHDQFDGEAKAAHTQVQAQVNEHFARLGEILNNTSIAVGNAQANYNDADAAGAKSFYNVSL